MVRSIAPLLRCPRCEGAIESAPELLCQVCGHAVPSFARAPCLLRDPEGYVEETRARLAAFEDEAARTSARLEAELRRPGLLESTSDRLRRRLTATERLASDVRASLLEIGAGRSTSGHAPRASILANLHYLHRDWGWARESDEHARALAFVQSVVRAPLGTTAVLGAGACRLAYDLHLDAGGDVTLALDLDPLLVAAGSRVLAGERVDLVEAPANPFDLDALDRTWALEAPRGRAEGLHLILADALRPPLAPGAFDTVITPWFVDQIVPDLRAFLGVMAAMLRPGGRWIFFGPLLYPLALAPSLRFTRQEVGELAALAGFTMEESVEGALDFSRSPLTKNGRTERCFAFSARLDGPQARAPGAPPAWLVLPYLAVPRASTPLEASVRPAAKAILDLVDGRRSVADIAAHLAKSLSTAEPTTLEDTVRHCLAAHHAEAVATG